MICGLQIGMLIFGILALVKGKMTLTKSKVVNSPIVYVVGTIFLLPLPLAMMAGFAFGFLSVARGGHPPQGNQMVYLSLFEVGLTLGCLVIGGIIGFSAAQPPLPERDYPEEEDDDDPRPELPRGEEERPRVHPDDRFQAG